MKDSGIEWIGEIPDEWETKKLKYICDSLTSGGTPDSNNDNYYCENGINWVSINDMSTVDFVEKTNKSITEQAVKDKNLIVYPIGTIVYSIYATLGHIAELKIPATINQALLALPLREREYNKNYFKYCLNTMKDYVLAFSSGNTQFNLNAYKVRNYVLVSPPKETQQKIATYLDEKCSQIEQTIQNQQQVIEKFKAYKQSLITEAVTGKVKIQNGKVAGKYEQYKDSGVEWIGEIPEGWEVKRLKYIADSFSKGSGITKEEIVINGDTPCVRYGELYTKYDYHFTECQTRTNLSIIETPKYFSHGDVLFTCTGELVEEIGKSIAYLGNEQCLAGGDIIVLKHTQEPMFMGYALDSSYVQGQKSFGKTKLKVVHISSGEIAGLLVALPPKEEQKEITDYLFKTCSSIDSAISQKQKLIEKLTEYKKSLIYECVTGKKEI